MIYDSFTVLFEMGPYCNKFLKKCSTLTEFFKIDPFIGELPNEIGRARISPAFNERLKIGFNKCFFSVADDRYGRIDKYEERVAIKLT